MSSRRRSTPTCTYIGSRIDGRWVVEGGSERQNGWRSPTIAGITCIRPCRRSPHSRQVRADFREVLSAEDADRQIADAARFIAAKTAGRATPFFAYPFGHYNDFLVHNYLPGLTPRVRAAFSIDSRAATRHDSLWCLPRYVCGDDWKSPQELAQLLRHSRAIAAQLERADGTDLVDEAAARVVREIREPLHDEILIARRLVTDARIRRASPSCRRSTRTRPSNRSTRARPIP